MLIPIKYHKRTYPPHIRTEIDEIAGHFDISSITPKREFCLHTEYSYGKRKFNSSLIHKFPYIINAHKKFVPRLWFNYNWASEFANFLQALCGDYKPKIIEIHPPFSDYINTIDNFLEIYKKFESEIFEYFPNVEIVIENRSGSIYSGGKFLVSNVDDLINLSEGIFRKGLNLKIALDIPQLITSYGGPAKLSNRGLVTILKELDIIREVVKSIHLWGKIKSELGRTISHVGDLNTYFEDYEKKRIFLEWFASFVGEDNMLYFVPEVNSSDKDLWSIVKDLESVGITFG